MRRVKRYLLLLVTIFLVSGCIKNNTTMTINKDKSVNLEVQILVKDDSKNKNTLSSNLDTADLEQRGFKVTTTNDNKYSGYKITKKFNNIDELTKGDGSAVEISNLFEEGFNFSKIFKKETSFFKDTYSANLRYSITNIKKKYNTTQIEEEYADSLEAYNEMEIRYVVVLPNKAVSSNATEKADSGKKLIWKLSSVTDSKMNYTFVFYNYKHIAIAGGGALLLIIIIIVIIAVIRKKKTSKGTLIYKEYDPSIEGELNNNEIIANRPEVSEQDTNMQVLESLEYTVEGDFDPNNPYANTTDNQNTKVVEHVSYEGTLNQTPEPIVSNPLEEGTASVVQTPVTPVTPITPVAPVEPVQSVAPQVQNTTGINNINENK